MKINKISRQVNVARLTDGDKILYVFANIHLDILEQKCVMIP